MKQLIFDIWNGNIHPIDECLKNRDIRDIESLLSKNKDDILKVLKDEEKEKFNKYADCADELLSICTEAAFTAGISFTTKLFIESLN